MVTTFLDWLKIRESSPITRARREAAFKLRPVQADFASSRSTPPPWEKEQLEKQIEDSKGKKKHHKHKKHDDDE